MASEDRLEAAFFEELSLTSRSRQETGVGAQIEAALERSRSAFPDFEVDDESFARCLARAAARWSKRATIADVVVEDLYLAHAHLQGVPGAANVLLTRYRGVILRTIEKVIGKSNAEEICQALVSDLLVGSGKSPPTIANYAGRAPLQRWLEAVGQKTALRWLRTECIKSNVAERASQEPRPGRETPNELKLFRQRYGMTFEQALTEALGRAPKAERKLLRLHLVNNISVEKIGKMLGVSQPTASRRLAKARESLLIDLKATLRERLDLSSGEIASLADLLRSRLDLSISQLLASDGDAP